MKGKAIAGAMALILAVGAITFFIEKENKKEDSVKEFTSYFSSSGRQLDEDNEIMEIIAQKTGAKCIESWENGNNSEAVINDMIAEGSYPDFISGNATLYEAGALVPLDDYIEKYPNLKSYLSEDEWNLLRQEDGHIYWIPQFGIVKNESNDFIHDGEAFWIQVRVLEWAGYPQVNTLDEYFDLLEAYYAANPYMPDGTTPNIPYTILCDDWKYFCLENPPQFLDGYPNDGSCIVDPDTMQVIDYNMTDTAKAYFEKLNEEYKKGIVDPESFTSTYQEYVDKLSTGAVLGMVDQRWDYYYGIISAYEENGLADLGCEYVPLPITISSDIKNQYHVNRSSEFDNSTGISVSISCQDVDGAMKFVNDLLDEDIMTLRYWGIEDQDFLINEDGEYYKTDEMREKVVDPDASLKHFCIYSYFPRYEGIMDDGINAYQPEYQTIEIQQTLSEPVKKLLDAYGVDSFVELLGTNEKPGDWYPMYSYSDTLTYSTEAGSVYNDLQYTKHLWLPQVVMADDFEATWTQYTQAYNDCNPQIFFDAMQEEVYRRTQH